MPLTSPPLSNARHIPKNQLKSIENLQQKKLMSTANKNNYTMISVFYNFFGHALPWALKSGSSPSLFFSIY
jgi:hypothetical protein